MSYAKRSFERSEIRIIDNSRNTILSLPKRMQHAALVGKTKMVSVERTASSIGRPEGAIG